MRRTPPWSVTTGLATLALAFSGCAASDSAPAVDDAREKPPPVRLAVHVARDGPFDEFRPAVDEEGAQFFIAPAPLLTDADVRSAEAWAGSARSLLQLTFNPRAADALERATRAAPSRLAVLVDDVVVLSPTVAAPVRGGRLLLDLRLEPRRVAEIADALNRQRVQWGTREQPGG